MEIIEVDPMPEVCANCAERKACVARGEGEWCCDECDHLGERFIIADSTERKMRNTKCKK